MGNKAITPEVKACSRCKNLFTLDNFYKKKNGFYLSACKPCFIKYSEIYRKRNWHKDPSKRTKNNNRAVALYFEKKETYMLELENEYSDNNGWSLIFDFPNYRINKDGVVVKLCPSLNKVRFPKFNKNKNGYPQVNLCHEYKRKYKRIHRLIALSFIDNPNNYKEVNHKDGNKLNWAINNLEWCTRSQNMKHAHETGLMIGIKNRNKNGTIAIGNKI